MRNNCIQLIKVFCYYFIFLFSFITTNAQKCDCSNSCNGVKPLPSMWVSESLANKRKEQLMRSQLFKASKYNLLKQTGRLYNNKPDFFISKNNLYSIITTATSTTNSKGLRIIFACFVKTGSDPSIKLNEGQIVLLYTAADEYKDFGECYVIDNDSVLHNVSNSSKPKWIEEYVKNVLPKFRKTIDINDDNNDGLGNYTDTKSIYYENKRIISALRNEIDNNTNLKDFTGLKVSISAYDKKGKDPTNYDGHTYKKRMILQFDYIIHGNKIFNFEDLPDFCCRKCNMDPNESFLKSKKNIAAVDNGHLCPANCPVN